MAQSFNYRPKTPDELYNSTKTYSDIAAQVLTEVMDEYGVGIVLNPDSNFKEIRIPRTVQDDQKKTIEQIKSHLKRKKIDLSDVVIKFGDGSGTGTKGTDATITKQQEQCTRLYCEVYSKTKSFPSSSKVKTIYPGVTDEWYNTFESQAQNIINWIGSNASDYKFSRDEKDGIMVFVETIAKKQCGVRTIDSWNPSDIYAVKKDFEKRIKEDITKIGNLEIPPRARLDELNNYMRVKLQEKQLIGFSLKKLSKGKVKTVEVTNATKKDQLIDISIVDNSIMFDLDLNDRNEFVTGEMSMKLKIKNDIVTVQIRAFSGGVRESTQMDMTGVGEAAKLGKVSSIEAIDPYLTRHSLQRRMGSSLPKVGGWTSSDYDKYVKEWNQIKNIKIGGQSIYWGKNPWDTTLTDAIKYEQENNRTASQLSSKLQCFQWVKIFNAIETQGRLKEFLTVLYYGAKKEYSSAGPFVKVA